MYLRLASLCIYISPILEPCIGDSYLPFIDKSSTNRVPDLSITIDTKLPECNCYTLYSGNVCKYRDIEHLWGYVYGNDADCIVPFSYMEDGLTTVAIIHLGEVPRRSVLIDGTLSVIIGNVLMRRNMIIFHASVVAKDGKTVVFSGRSGVGKSTQARLWKDFCKAEIVNHDKPLIYSQNGVFYASGSPWSGSVFCHKNISYPLTGIVFLEQGTSNDLKPMTSIVRKFPYLMRNSCSPVLTNTDYSLLQNTLEQIAMNVPIYHYSCLPDQNSVTILYSELFGKETKSENQY